MLLNVRLDPDEGFDLRLKFTNFKKKFRKIPKIPKVSEKFQTTPVVIEVDERLDPRINPRTTGEVIEMIDIMIENDFEMLDFEFVDQQLTMPHAENAQHYGAR